LMSNVELIGQIVLRFVHFLENHLGNAVKTNR
jgi:hypothetical protein